MASFIVVASLGPEIRQLAFHQQSSNGGIFEGPLKEAALVLEAALGFPVGVSSIRRALRHNPDPTKQLIISNARNMIQSNKEPSVVVTEWMVQDPANV